MKKTLGTISLIAVLSGLTTAANAQEVLVWQDDFESATLGANSADGSYGAISWNWSAACNPVVTITNNNLLGTNIHNCAFTFDTSLSSGPLNFGLRINQLPATGNTNTSLRAYHLDFDVAVQGPDVSSLGGYIVPQIGLFGNGGGMYYQDGCLTNPPVSFFPATGSGYQHCSMPLDSFSNAHANMLPPTDGTLTFYVGFVVYGLANVGIEEIDVENVQLWMTNPPVLPPPTMNVVPAKPGLRVFAQDNTFPYNQEGFGTVNLNQSWVGVATPANPVSYAVTFADFDTVNGYACFVQFAPGADPGDPFGVYNANHSLTWSITHAAPGSGFTTSVDWKTNWPGHGNVNNALALTTTTTDGRGTWILTFTNDTDGTVYAPDGTSGSFSLDPGVAALFANPVTIDFGSCPNWNTAGYGQWITYSKIAITNVIDGNEYDDFTQDASFNTALWNPNFSYNHNPAPNCVIQVSTNTPYWVNWTVPDEGFGLGTKASLVGGTNVWFSPNYYGNGVVTNTTPTVMGGTMRWTLIPSECLPTVDGTVGGAVSPQGFFRLSNPPPTQ